MKAIDMMTPEQREELRSYNRKQAQGKLSEATQEERDAKSLYNNLRAQCMGYKDETDRQYSDPVKYRYIKTKSKAKQRGILFDITLEDWRKLAETSTHCPIFGTLLVWECTRSGKKDLNCASPDRIDNTKGYTLDNLWFISWRANKAKGDSTPQELMMLAQALQQRLTS